MIQRVDAHLGELAVLGDGGRGHDHVVGVGQRRIVQLQDEARVHDGLVLVLHRVGQREQILLVVRIMFVVEEVLQPARRQHAHERLLGSRSGFRQRPFEQRDIVRHFLLADVGDGSVADGALRRQELLEVQVLVKLREFDALTRVAAHPAGFARIHFARRQPREPPAIVGEAEADFAQLAVADDVDARVGLFADGLGDAGLHASHHRGEIGASAGHKAEGHLAQIARTIQAPGVRGENAIGAVFHASHCIAAGGYTQVKLRS